MRIRRLYLISVSAFAMVRSIFTFTYILLSTNFQSTSLGEYGSSAKLNDAILIAVDEHFVSVRSSTTAEISDIYKYVLKTHTFQYGSITVQFSPTLDVKLSKDLTSVLAVGNCSDIWNLYNNAADMDILYLTITDNQCDRLPTTEAITIPLTDSRSEIPQLIMDLKQSRSISWHFVTVIADNSIDDDLLNDVITALTSETVNEEGISVSIFKVQNAATDWERRKIMYELFFAMNSNRRDNFNYLIITRSELLPLIIESMYMNNLGGPETQWLMVLPDAYRTDNSFESLAGLIKEGENFSFLLNMSNRNRNCTSGLTCHLEELLRSLIDALDTSILQEIELSQHVSEEEWETIKPAKSNRRDSLLTFIKAKLIETGTCNNCTLWQFVSSLSWGNEFFSAMPTVELVTTGVWQPQLGLKLFDNLFPHSVHRFRDKILPIISFHQNPPWQILQSNSSGHVVKYSGLIFDIINELAKSLNFSYDVIVVPSRSSANTSKFSSNNEIFLEGNENPLMESTWDTMYNLIQRKKVFLGAAAFKVDRTKKYSINYTTAVSIESYNILTCKAKQLSRALLFTAPFTWGIWICIALAVAVMTPILYYFHYYSPYYDYKHVPRKGGLNSPINCFWYIYGALLQQGGTHLPAADSGRLVIGTWWIFVLVIVTTYSGNLVAFLTFPQMDTVVTNVDELLIAGKESGITWGIPNGSSLQKLLMSLHEETRLKQLYDNAELHSNVSQEVMDRIRIGKHVYIDYKTNLLFLMKNEFQISNSCDFSLGTTEFLDEKFAMVMPYNSPYLKLINKEIKRMHFVGLIHKWILEYLPKKDRCWNTKQTDVTNHTVNLNDMQGSFFVLLLGFVVGFVTVGIEFLCKKYRKIKETNIIHPFVL